METALELVASKQIIISILMILAAIVISRLISRSYKIYIKNTDKDIKTYAFVRGLFEAGKLSVWFLIVLAVLEINNINITSIVAGVGVAGAIFGFAMQDLIKDILMGIHIVNNHAFHVGDVIVVDGDKGVVTMFTLNMTQYTSLLTEDKVTICNRDISKVALAGTMLDIDVPLGYNVDPDLAREVLIPCVDRIAGLEGVKDAEYLGTNSFEASAVLYRIRLHANPMLHYKLRRSALAEVQRTLIKAGLEIPFNQLDVTIKS